MLDIAALEDTVWGWVKAVSGLDDQHVIFSHQDGPSPDEVAGVGGPYFTILVLDDADTLGMYPEQQINADGEPFTVEHWRLDGLIEAFGAGARQALLNFKSKCLLPSFYGLLQTDKVEADPGALTFLPNPRNRAWEEHAKLEVVFRLADGETVDHGVDGETPPQYFDHISYTAPELAPHPLTDPVTITNPDT